MYVESSHANNTGIAKFINDCVYDTKTPMQLDDSDCRTTINGFPIEVYVNGEYLGVYNFNHDRYSYKSYGYDYNKYPNMLVYEINSNSNTSAGAFYRYGDNAESSANVSELEYYKRDFNLIYGNRTTDSDSYSEIKTLVEWVSVAEQDLFREMISEHFNKEYLFRYFLTVLMIGAVDSLGKNMKIMTINGQVWYPTFYDLDTVLGIDNSGYLTIEPDVEIESGSYNTSNSNLWSKVWNYFNTELKEEWAKMRQGSFTLDNLMNYVYGEQISKIPAKLYNDDAQVKYLEFGSLYTYCCHGSKEHQIRRWLRERIAYVDSMLGYFTSQEDQVTIRMNKDGKVSFDVTPYIPLYFSVKWSNATGGTQTFKLKRGETKTFNYSSTTSTDQEVIIYHAKYIKRLDNLSNLNPSSCILSNAVKLTNVEIHSSELYNINVTNNKFLRSINLENCTALGTVTATGSSLNLSNCKYLRYCNVYNTHLTEVQLNTSGGSLTEIYYPKSIQSINLVKQRLLELVGLPYGEKGSEIPTSLYTISIQECPSITKLNTSSDTTIASSFASMVYVNNLTIRNSLDLASLKFDGFHRLQNVTIENMYNLEEVGFNNLLPVGETSTIKYIGMSNCPKLGTIELNCTSNDYEITFADDAILNFGGLFKLNSITSNCVLKGIKTIVVPINLESMFFTNEYGSGYSTIENIWVSSQCNVDTQATTPVVTHVDSTYSGIDFLGMNLKNIDLGALVNIPKAINFKLSPTTVNPHFNLNRDGETYKYLQPVGTLDLSNYTESLAKFFDGVDLDKLEIICNNNLPQTDLSYCFYNSSFSTNEAINKLLTKVSSITNLDYCFYKTTIDSVDILDEINMGASSSMNYTFAECPNIKTLNNVVIPSTVTSVEGMFNKCPLTTITNMIVNVRGSISGLFKGCNKLTTITTLRIPNVTDVSNTFDGCTSLSSLSGFELPSSCTNVSNLFNGCYMLTELGMEFGANITAGDNWYPPNLETLHDTTISNDYVKLTNCTTLKTLNNVNISGGDLSDLFNGCTNLVDINRCTFNATRSLARAFKGCSKITINPITTIVDTVTDISEMYSGCTGITDISGMTFGSGITSATDWCHKAITTANNVTIKNNLINFRDYTNLTTCLNLDVRDVTSMENFFQGCSSLTTISLYPPSRACVMTALCNRCSSLVSIEYLGSNKMKPTSILNGFRDIGSQFNYEFTTDKWDFSNCRSISYMFYGNTGVNISMRGANLSSLNINMQPFSYPNVVDFTGSSFGFNFNITAANNLFFGSVSNIILDNCTFSGSLNIQFNYGDNTNGGLQTVSMNNITVLDDLAKDWSNMFHNCTKLTSDVVIPSSVTNCSNAFKNCTSMTNIHANWNNSYDNEITSTDCYAGCTGIKLIDGESVVLYPGDNSLDYIPFEWGGYGLTGDYVSVFEINIPSDNYTLTPLYYFYGFTHRTSDEAYRSEKNTISWGDGNHYGSSDILNDSNYDSTKGGINGNITGPSHTYAEAGTYYIKGTFYSGGYRYHGTMGSCIVKCLKLASKYYQESPKDITSLSNEFSGCSNLTYVDLSSYKNNNNLTILSQLFTNCTSLTLDNIVGLNNLNLSNITHMTGMFSGCTKITQLPFTTIPDSVTNIGSIFKKTGITDISGLTIGSGVTQASNWLTDSPITTANNVTIKCSGLTFNSSTLTTCNNLTVTSTCNNLKDLFRGCKSLNSITFNSDSDFSNVTTMQSTFTSTAISSLDLSNVTVSYKLTSLYGCFSNCTKLTEITMFNKMEEASLSDISEIFIGNEEHLTTLRNFKLGSNCSVPLRCQFAFKYTTGKGTIISNTDGMYINCDCLRIRDDDTGKIRNEENGGSSNLYYSLFAGCDSIVKFTELELGPNVTDISNGFRNIKGLTEDVTLPSHITNCTNAFKDCTSMTHIHSNWNNTYTNGITSTDCYAGCTGITHCDGIDLGVNEYINGLDEVPPSWGGYGFYSETTGIYVFEIPSDNYTITLKASNNNHGLIGDGVVAWGDGTSTTMEISHTYTTSGRYVVKMHGYTSDNEYPHDSIKNSLVEVVKLPYREYTLTKLFCQCSKLTKVNMSNITTSFGYLFVGSNSLTEIIAYNVTLKGDCGGFQQCSYLERLEGLNTWNTSQATSMANLFNGCGSLTELDLSSFDTSNVTSMENMFKNYGMDVSDSKLKIIRGIENFNTSKVTNMTGMFQGQKSLESLDLSSWNTAKVTDMSSMFENCTKLQTIIGLENWNTSSVYTIVNMFKDCKGLSDFPNIQNWNLSNCAKFDGLFYGAGCSGTFRPNWNLANIGYEPTYGITSMFRDLNTAKATAIDLSNCTIPITQVIGAAGYVFANSPYITEVKLPNNLKVRSIGSWFKGCSRLSSIDMSNVDFSECMDMSAAFKECTNITSITFSDTINISKVNNMGNMFSGCSSLITLDLSNLDVRKVTTFESMCEGCTNLQTVTGIETWTTTNTKISKMFYNCSSLTSDIDMHNITAYVSDSNALYTFGNCASIRNIIAPKFTSNSMAPFGMFKGATSLEKVTFTEFSDFLTGVNVNNCSQSEYVIGFYQNSNLTTIEGDFNVNFTNRMGSKHYTDNYWIPYAFSWFKLCNRLTNINFTGTIYSASNFTKYGIFNSCNTSNLTNESWQSFVNIFPENTDGVTKYISVGTSTAYIPEVYASQLTAKGYTLVTNV